jgi:predicted dehydrogenase
VSENRIGIGLVSFAHMHAFSYGRELLKRGDAELVGVADTSIDRAKDAAHTLGVSTTYPSISELLADTAIHAVVICSENARHADHAMAAAEAGKHILCEKPLATTPDDAARMVDAARRAGVKLMTAFPCRFHPAAARTEAAISSGRIGKPLAVNGTNHGKNPGGWFVDPALSGGGAIADHTVHVVDLLRWMTGQEVEEVFAEATQFDASLPCEDGGILSLKFTDFIATLDASWSNPPSNPIWGDVTMEVIGTEGVLSLDLFAQQHQVVREHGDLRVALDAWGDSMDGGLVNEFVSAIREDRDPSVSGVDGQRAVEVVAAAYRSVASKRPEPVTSTT